MPHVKRAKVTRRDAVHVTIRVVAGLRSLRGPRNHALIRRVFAAERERKGFRLVHYAIQSNHLHLVCEADETRALSRGIQRLGARIGRGVNRLWQRRGRLFADRFHARVLRSPRQVRNLLAYVLLNAHKDMATRGVRIVGIDPLTSARSFDGWADEKEPPERAPPSSGDSLPWRKGARAVGNRDAQHGAPDGMDVPVTVPRSWLLRVGWRRFGLLRTDEKAPKQPG